ncbi:hypothetical protein FJZ48_00065 [Candidatus Uhrbacteria bacterium]|nr:hypothetical protein [Candidatus Uhrbacteria bacterium]
MEKLTGKPLKEQLELLILVWNLFRRIDNACRQGLRVINGMGLDDAVMIGPKFLAEHMPAAGWLVELFGDGETVMTKIAKLNALGPESTVKQVRKVLSDVLDFTTQSVMGWVKSESVEAGLTITDADFRAALARPNDRGSFFKRLENRLRFNNMERIRIEKKEKAAAHERDRRAELERLRGEINECLSQLGFGMLPVRECGSLKEVEVAITDYTAQLARYDARLKKRRRGNESQAA